jgi:hypothetical protein
MESGKAQQPETASIRWIQDSARRAEARVRRLRLTNRAAVVLGLIASFIATVFAATVAKEGMLGSLDWSQACWVIAGFTGLTTLSSGLQAGLDIPANLAKMSSCLGRLRELELAASMGNRSAAEISKECEAIAREYPEILV